ncbi:hypothetical protein AVEN_117717-1 [Araneus ventricosus]|uniref:BTB domain-containing protein n=1 Tax=Araneus ventricosus TaxID=182803 RepID=A0A4Y2PY05_ARAVE|nr:hypothetical protein AVEN_117717-1 [Araneus ventricosus]
MWKRNSPIFTTDFCHARTEMTPYRRSIVWAIEEFNALNSSTTEDFRKLASNEKKVYTLKPFSVNGPSMTLILYLKSNYQSEDVYVDFLIEGGEVSTVGCEISVLDTNGKVIESKVERGRTFYSWTILEFWPLVSKRKLMDNKNLFLPNGTLHLRCSLETCFGGTSTKIEYCTRGVATDFKRNDDSSAVFAEEIATEKNPLESEEYFMKEVDGNDSFNHSIMKKNIRTSCRDSCPLKAALRYLHKDPTLSDINLRVGAKPYSVHRNILCSRCPTFKKIFGNDEKTVEIKDMDENTLCRLLQYIYTDTVEDLEVKNALNLFKTADEYQLSDLRHECSYFLRNNLSETNLCEILSLAKKYRDEELERDALALQEFSKLKDKIEREV